MVVFFNINRLYIIFWSEEYSEIRDVVDYIYLS